MKSKLLNSIRKTVSNQPRIERRLNKYNLLKPAFSFEKRERPVTAMSNYDFYFADFILEKSTINREKILNKIISSGWYDLAVKLYELQMKNYTPRMLFLYAVAFYKSGQLNILVEIFNASLKIQKNSHFTIQIKGLYDTLNDKEIVTLLNRHEIISCGIVFNQILNDSNSLSIIPDFINKNLFNFSNKALWGNYINNFNFSDFSDVMIVSNEFYSSSTGADYRINSMIDSLKNPLVIIMGPNDIKFEKIKNVNNCKILPVFAIPLINNIDFQKSFENINFHNITMNQLPVGISELYTLLIQSVLSLTTIEKVFIEYLKNAFFVNAVKIRKYKTCVDTHDILFDRYISYEKYGLTPDIPSYLNKNNELKLLAINDQIITINERDKKLLESLPELENNEIIHVANNIEVFNATRPSLIKSVGFVGGPQKANLDGIIWFIENKLGKDDFKNCKLKIYGNICGQLSFYATNPDIYLYGFIDDISDAYKSVDAIVAPLLYGSGLKIKVIEALQHNKVVFSTDIGYQGLEHLVGEQIIHIE